MMSIFVIFSLWAKRIKSTKPNSFTESVFLYDCIIYMQVLILNNNPYVGQNFPFFIKALELNSQKLVPSSGL